MRLLRFLIGVLIGLVLIGAIVWGDLALYYADFGNDLFKYLLIGVFSVAGLAVLLALVLRRGFAKSLLIFTLLFAVLIGWWFTIPPSNDRDWQADVARLTYADIQGDLVTVHNVRNFDYRSETDYTPVYYDKTYDLRKLESVDLIAVYWMGPAIAHTFLSFGFEGGDQIAISIETRKEKNEAYSTLKGFFRQYELYYVVADERDVIRLRTNYRKDPPEEVYIYNIQGRGADRLENARRLFLKYIARVNELKAKPEFYNTLLDNCTTGIWMNARVNPGPVPLSWKVLASGYLPEYLYESGVLVTGHSFEELQRLGHANIRAHAADQAIDFSKQIRKGVPRVSLQATGTAVPAGHTKD